MRAPRTYTGEDVVELSCHGSGIILQGIVEACVAAGARVAEPGEFTRRAYLSGKMDLVQAEAVCDLIGAQGERGSRLAKEQLEGRLSREIQSIASDIADARTQVEASIDFPEEGIEGEAGLLEKLGTIEARIDGLSKSFDRGRFAREGVRTAIVGRPNSGKSSLLNLLAGCERAIVHHAPGTTRDVVEEGVTIDGVVFRFRDTAGIRCGASEVESLGIERSRRELANSDLALVVFDGSREFSSEDAEIVKLTEGMRSVYVVNKSDLPQRFDIEELSTAPIRCSALTGAGLSDLTARLGRQVLGDGGAVGEPEGVTITSSRHRALLEETAFALTGAMGDLAGEAPPEVSAQKLRQAHDALGGITGEVTTDEILDRIFSQFCIGK